MQRNLSMSQSNTGLGKKKKSIRNAPLLRIWPTSGWQPQTFREPPNHKDLVIICRISNLDRSSAGMGYGFEMPSCFPWLWSRNKQRSSMCLRSIPIRFYMGFRSGCQRFDSKIDARRIYTKLRLGQQMIRQTRLFTLHMLVAVVCFQPWGLKNLTN